MANQSKLQTATFVAVSTEKLQRGLVKEMGDLAVKLGRTNFADFVNAFCGRQFNGTKVTQYQLRRHVSWMKSHGVLKVVVKARAAKAGAR
jgi:hypothetical protein